MLNIANLSYLDTSQLSSPDVQQLFALVNQETAQRILEHHHGRNRSINPKTVRRYKDDITAGVWTFAGDPLRFDHNGMLIDGQHRLAAIAQLNDPNIAIPFSILLGLPPESIKTMDQGAKRTAGQQLDIAGVKNYNTIAAGAKIAYHWNQGTLNRSSHGKVISTPVIEQYVHDHRHIIDHVNDHMYKIRNNDIPNGPAVACAIIFTQVDPDAEREFFTLLSEGGEPKGSPINTLDRKMAKMRRDNTRQRAEETIAMVFKAWNAWRDGKNLTRLTQLRDDEPFPAVK